MPARSSRVNLLPPSEFEQSFWGRFIKWAVSTGRYLIILTELVVIVAFLSRFKLDQDLSDLNQNVKSQIMFLDSQITIEEKYLQTAKKLSQAGLIIQSRPEIELLLKYLSEKKPEEVEISQLVLNSGGLNLTAVTLNEQSMNNLLKTFSADKTWSTVELTQVVSQPTTGIRFILQAKQ